MGSTPRISEEPKHCLRLAQTKPPSPPLKPHSNNPTKAHFKSGKKVQWDIKMVLVKKKSSLDSPISTCRSICTQHVWSHTKTAHTIAVSLGCKYHQEKNTFELSPLFASSPKWLKRRALWRCSAAAQSFSAGRTAINQSLQNNKKSSCHNLKLARKK